MKKKLFLLFAASAVLVGCKDPEENGQGDYSSSYTFINEGPFQQDGATLTSFTSENDSSAQEVFLTVNDRQLGSIANDIENYGGKTYIAINGTGTIEVLNKRTGQSVKQINLGVNSSPRQLAVSSGKVFVSCYDGTVRVIDTTSLTETMSVTVRANPEGITVLNGKVYVANSGSYNGPVYDSVISVIDANSGVVEAEIIADKNIGDLVSVNGYVYAAKGNEYDMNWAITRGQRLVKIDPNTNTVVSNVEMAAGNLQVSGGNLFIQQGTSIAEYDPSTDQIIDANFIDASSYTAFYGFSALANGEFAAYDAVDYTSAGSIYIYSASGTLLHSLTGGIIPTGGVYTK